MILIVLFSLLTFVSCAGMEKEEQSGWKQEFFALGEQLLRNNNTIINDPAERETELVRKTLIHLAGKTGPKDYQSLLCKAVQAHPEWVALTDGLSSNPLRKLVRRQLACKEFNAQELLPWKAYVNHRVHYLKICCLDLLATMSAAQIHPICHLQLIDFLIRIGANPNSPYGRSGRSPLHTAVACNTSIVVKNLLNFKEVNVNALDREHRTPLDIALLGNTSEANVEIRRALRDAGALTCAEILQKNNRSLQQRCIACINTHPDSFSREQLTLLPPDMHNEITALKTISES